MKSTNIQTAIEIGRSLESGNIPYQFTYAAALLIQGVSLQEPVEMTVDVQWDLFNEAHQLFKAYSPSHPIKHLNVRRFNLVLKSSPFELLASIIRQ